MDCHKPGIRPLQSSSKQRIVSIVIVGQVRESFHSIGLEMSRSSVCLVDVENRLDRGIGYQIIDSGGMESYLSMTVCKFCFERRMRAHYQSSLLQPRRKSASVRTMD